MTLYRSSYRALAKRFWPNESPIGRRIRYYGDWLSIIGVCGNMKHARLDAESDMEIYVPYLQLPDDVAQFVGRDLNFVVRTDFGIGATEMRNALRAVLPSPRGAPVGKPRARQQERNVVVRRRIAVKVRLGNGVCRPERENRVS